MVRLEHNNVQKCNKFLVVPGKGQALLGMPYTDMLNIKNIDCNTIDKLGNDSTNNCSTNNTISQTFKTCAILYKHDAEC